MNFLISKARQHSSITPLLILVILIIAGCEWDKGKNIPDVSNIDIDLKVNRFEQDLFKVDTNNVAEGLTDIAKKYPEFSVLFFNRVLGTNDPRIAPEGPEKYIRGFLTHPPLLKLQDTCQIVYGDFAEFEAEFEQAFKFLKYHFPETPTPEITTFFSEFSYGGFIYNENSLAVGLEFYLGSDFPYLQYNPGNDNFSSYLTRTFNKDHLVARTLMPLITDIIGEPSGNRMLDIMVNNGKKRYLLEQLLPYQQDTVIQEFSSKHLQWLEDNEFQIWSLFLEKEFLYSSKGKEISNYIRPSPNSPGMPKEAPGNSASWIGYKMVKEYMRRNPEQTILGLLQQKDAQKLMQASKYKPKY